MVWAFFPPVASHMDFTIIFTCLLNKRPLFSYILEKAVSVLLAIHFLRSKLLWDNQSLASPLPSIIRGWMCQLSYPPTNLDTITPFPAPGTPAQSSRLTSKGAWSVWEELINLDCYLIAVLQECLQALIKIKVLSTEKTYNEE